MTTGINTSVSVLEQFKNIKIVSLNIVNKTIFVSQNEQFSWQSIQQGYFIRVKFPNRCWDRTSNTGSIKCLAVHETITSAISLSEVEASSIIFVRRI